MKMECIEDEVTDSKIKDIVKIADTTFANSDIKSERILHKDKIENRKVMDISEINIECFNNDTEIENTKVTDSEIDELETSLILHNESHNYACAGRTTIPNLRPYMCARLKHITNCNSETFKAMDFEINLEGF